MVVRFQYHKEININKLINSLVGLGLVALLVWNPFPFQILELKTFDFDKSSDEFAQFAIAFPKSWNEGTITFQAFFTANSTDTGTVSWALAGVALADNDSLNTAFGTAVAPTAKAHSGTANDLDVTAESGAVTIAGSPSVDEYVFFEIFRDVSADDLDADAKLLVVKLFFTTDAANDA